jgi:hypothetical protein
MSKERDCAHNPQLGSRRHICSVEKVSLTVFALALFDLRLVSDVLVASFAVEPGSAKKRVTNNNREQEKLIFNLYCSSILYPHLLTSSADCAMKNPTVLDGSLVPLGLIEILLSPPSSAFTSIASNKSFSLTKHSLIG